MEPIVYYVDPGAPEPVRSALIEGASWWAEAFDAAGFIDAFRVELLPEGVHPLDARYNVIEWVHRSTRGWSYGGGLTDPRTGEMIKAHVNLGSLRVRQDRLIFEGLLGVAATGSGAADDPVELALARIRQLAAHEVGHTLGFTHNFAASTWGGRASVMDYPAPLVRVTSDGGLDVSKAYAVGAGEWDVQAVAWAYSEFAPGTDENAALEAIVQEGIAAGRLFLSDADARPAGAAHPAANLWDNGADPVNGTRAGTCRAANGRSTVFGERNIAAGTAPRAPRRGVGADLLLPSLPVERGGEDDRRGGLSVRVARRRAARAASRSAAADQRRALDALLIGARCRRCSICPTTCSMRYPRGPFGYRRQS